MTAFVMFVFGKKYQNYLPLLLLSIKYAYPSYDFILFVDRPIHNKVKRLIEKIQFNKLIIKEIDYRGFSNTSKKNIQVKKSLRWLTYDSIFLNYKYLYIGDVDIFICKESVSMHSQHISHMKMLQLPYSNSIRRGTRRLSGLHFIEVVPYYENVKKNICIIKSEINSALDHRKSMFNLNNMNDENILFELLDISKLINSNLSKYPFRPTHGLHLGIWRLKDLMYRSLKKGKRNINYNSNKYYYNYFKNIYENDLTFKYIFENSNKALKGIVNRMIKGFESHN